MSTADDARFVEDYPTPESLSREQHEEYAAACRRYAQSMRERVEAIQDGTIKFSARLLKRIPKERMVNTFTEQAAIADNKAAYHEFMASDEGQALLGK